MGVHDVGTGADAETEARPDASVGGRCLLGATSVRVVRVGNGGNCSSVGSVIDTLFIAAAAGGALLAAILSAMQDEEVTIVGSARTPDVRAEPREPSEVEEP